MIGSKHYSICADQIYGTFQSGWMIARCVVVHHLQIMTRALLQLFADGGVMHDTAV